MAKYSQRCFRFPFEQLTAFRPKPGESCQIDFYQAPSFLIFVDRELVQLLKGFEPLKRITVCPTWNAKVRVEGGEISVESDEQSSFNRLVACLSRFHVPDSIFPTLNARLQAENKCPTCRFFTYGESTSQRLCRRELKVPNSAGAKWCRSHRKAAHTAIFSTLYAEASANVGCV